MKVIKILSAALVLSLASSMAMAEKVAVIVNANNSQNLSKSDIAAIYSDKIVQWSNGKQIKSYDLPVKNSARSTFSEKVLGMSAKDAAKEWANRKITNTAKNPPKTKKERLVLIAVRKNVNAVGYVPAASAKGAKGIKVLMTID